jgi:hypothetical protein
MEKIKLFCLRYGKGGCMVLDTDNKPLLYSNKMSAKKSRLLGMVVSYGSNHKKYRHVKGDV